MRIAVDFEGTERIGIPNVMLSNDNEKFITTTSNIKQDETRWIEVGICVDLTSQEFRLLREGKMNGFMKIGLWEFGELF